MTEGNRQKKMAAQNKYHDLFGEWPNNRWGHVRIEKEITEKLTSK